MSTGPFDLSKTPLHLEDSGEKVVPQEGFGFDGPSFMGYIDKYCKNGSIGRLVMIESTPGNWPAWECHTQGDEIVIILEGTGEFIQEIDGKEQRIRFEPGVTVINPMGVWHTADVEQPLRAIYITPIPGTESRPR